jgi:hypothetical protein
MPRDNFTQKTISKLAERVGFLCSNPNCRMHTVGPNSRADSSTRIGKAAHITAASAGGPRYDISLSIGERSNINNGIWLCSNCSDMVDKDEINFPTPLLNKWKAEAEHEMYGKIKGTVQTEGASKNSPFLEAELIFKRGLRSPGEYSNKNPVEQDPDGRYVMLINVGSKPIIHWELTWQLDLVIHNNSSFPAYNIKVTSESDILTLTLSTLPKINSLDPRKNIELKITYIERLEDTHVEADRRISHKIPEALNGITFIMSYFDESRNEYQTLATLNGREIVNNKKIS